MSSSQGGVRLEPGLGRSSCATLVILAAAALTVGGSVTRADSDQI